MGDRPRKVVYLHAIWDWVDQKMSSSNMRDEEATMLKEAGTLLALQESAYKRALHDLMEQILDEDGPYVVDLDKSEEEDAKFEEDFAISNPTWNKHSDEFGDE
jgi:hypothetical protein